MDEAVTPWNTPGGLCALWASLALTFCSWVANYRCLSYPLDTGTYMCLPTKPHEETEARCRVDDYDSPYLGQAVLVLGFDEPFKAAPYQPCLTVLPNNGKLLHLDTALLHLTDWMLAGWHPPKEAAQLRFQNVPLQSGISSTRQTYYAQWKWFSVGACQRQISPVTSPISTILDYLLTLTQIFPQASI